MGRGQGQTITAGSGRSLRTAEGELKLINNHLFSLAQEAIANRVHGSLSLQEASIARFNRAWSDWLDVVHNKEVSAQCESEFQIASETAMSCIEDCVGLIEKVEETPVDLMVSAHVKDVTESYRESLVKARRGPSAVREASHLLRESVFSLAHLLLKEGEMPMDGPASKFLTSVSRTSLTQERSLRLLNEWEDEEYTVLRSLERAQDVLDMVWVSEEEMEQAQENMNFSEAAEWESDLEVVLEGRDEVVGELLRAHNILQERIDRAI